MRLILTPHYFLITQFECSINSLGESSDKLRDSQKQAFACDIPGFVG